ncbi:hypothetical protein IFM47457_04139 [Aspergillus lentulus]|nr:hypothetical protein IFM47457_04139 [Aspergillus lentulus]
MSGVHTEWIGSSYRLSVRFGFNKLEARTDGAPRISEEPERVHAVIECKAMAISKRAMPADTQFSFSFDYLDSCGFEIERGTSASSWNKLLLDKGVYIAQFNDKALEAAAAIGINPTRACPYSAAAMSNEAQLLMLRIAKDILSRQT